MLFRIFIVLFFLSNSSLCQISFVENKGQLPVKINYYSDIPSGKIFFEKHSIVYNFYDQNHFSNIHKQRKKLDYISGHSYKVSFKNSNKDVIISNYSKTDTYYNFFHGNNKNKYVSNVNSFHSILYNSIYNNIDVQFYSNNHNLKYDFIIRPGGKIKDIKLRI